MKILIVTKNWLGDILFEIPALEMIRKQYPDADIFCMAHPRCKTMLENHPAIHQILEFDERGEQASLLAKIQWIRRLWRLKIDQAYFFHRSRTRAFLLMLAGIKQRIGYAVKKPHFLTQAYPEPKQALHHVDYFTGLLAAHGFEKPANPQYRFYHSELDEKTAQSLIEKNDLSSFVCFHLGANWEPKRWPPAHFARLADFISEQWGLKVVLTGGPDDQKLGKIVQASVNRAKVISLIGETSLGTLGALFSKASFVVSSDSGPMHIASGAGARVAAIFGPTHPDLTGPRGTGESLIFHYVPQGFVSPWYGKDFPIEPWLSRITPETVFEGIRNKGWQEEKNQISNLKVSSSQQAAQKHKRILINTLSNIGDVILTTPVIMSLAKQFPDSKLTVIVGPRARGILEGSRYIDRLVIYDKQATLAQKINFLKGLREDSYDLVVDLKNSAIPFLVSAKKRSPLFRRFREVSARARHLEILKNMKLTADPVPAFDFYGLKEEKSVSEKLKSAGLPPGMGWIVIVPLAASQVKSWPMAYYQKLIEGLLQETRHAIVLAGGPKEKELMGALSGLDSRVLNLAGETQLRELAALIANSELLIANDSSAAQLGFEMDHPSAVIFGPTDPKKFAREGENFRILRQEPECSPCEKAQCRFERQACLLDLAPEKVLGACLELLAPRGVEKV